ncbi:RIP metalloprotease RseP [Mucilaginibacter psychrotolerans]|uniref:Zinc metalloprotease n=1 Tax=Mucilaginibacter psychrotolerans TaxID=1524096 RepID=A0A4Y8SMG6_9SPHI|nr:RIP metalloprotease RseP [Mucilaginibacter psychrotolerans]TFF39576.1 RIP metalloprotease RseP [Mucilaginibacter psychrotolerans]
MDILIMVGQLILGLSILVILHEFGHFIAARAFGIRVEKFYLFFDAWNFSLFKFNYKGVEYGIGWLPLGGYVKIAGMIDESMDTDQLAGPPQPHEFRSKPAWQRLIVMLGGIIVNIFVGIFIFWMLVVKYGETYTPNANARYGIVPGVIGQKIGLRAGDKIPTINGKTVERFDDLSNSKVLLDNTVLNVERGSEHLDIKVPSTILNDLSDDGIEDFISRAPRSKFSVDSVFGDSKKAGLQKGDSIVAVNGKNVQFFDEFQALLQANKNKQVQLSVKRSDTTVALTAKVDSTGRIGFYRPKKEVLGNLVTTKYSFFASLPIGAAKAWDMFASNAKGIKKIFSGQVKATKAVSSPIRIAQMFGSTIDWIRFWTLVGFLSMVLALTNLLPIPGLDGGHTVFLLIEMIKGKPLSDKFLERAQIVGFVLLISLMVFAFGNDIFRIFTKHK